MTLTRITDTKLRVFIGIHIKGWIVAVPMDSSLSTDVTPGYIEKLDSNLRNVQQTFLELKCPPENKSTKPE